MARTYETWEVTRLLAKHPDWKASAPDTSDFFKCSASSDGKHVHFCALDFDGEPLLDAPIRSDWTITKPKKKRRRIVSKGRITGSAYVNFDARDKLGGCVVSGSVEGLDPSKTYKLVLVEVPE